MASTPSSTHYHLVLSESMYCLPSSRCHLSTLFWVFLLISFYLMGSIQSFFGPFMVLHLGCVPCPLAFGFNSFLNDILHFCSCSKCCKCGNFLFLSIMLKSRSQSDCISYVKHSYKSFANRKLVIYYIVQPWSGWV